MTTEERVLKKGWRLAWRQAYEKHSDLFHRHGDVLWDDEAKIKLLCEKTNAGYAKTAVDGQPRIIQWYEWYDEATPKEQRCDGSYRMERK